MAEIINDAMSTTVDYLNPLKTINEREKLPTENSKLIGNTVLYKIC